MPLPSLHLTLCHCPPGDCAHLVPHPGTWANGFTSEPPFGHLWDRTEVFTLRVRVKVRLRIDLCNGVGQGAVNTHVFTPTPTFTPTHLHPCILAHSHIPHTHSHIPHTRMHSHPHTCTYLCTLPQTPTHTFTPTHTSKPDSQICSMAVGLLSWLK